MEEQFYIKRVNILFIIFVLKVFFFLTREVLMIIGYYPITNGYGASSTFASPATEPLAYQTTVDPAMALAYMQQQQPAYFQGYQPNVAYQAQLAQLYASRQAQIQQLQAIQSQPVSILF